MVSTLPSPGRFEPGADPEQGAVAALDHGAAVVEVAQPPAFGDLRLRLLPSASRSSRSLPARRSRRLLRRSSWSMLSWILASLAAGSACAFVGAVDPLGQLAELRARAALRVGDAGLERGKLAAELRNAVLKRADRVGGGEARGRGAGRAAQVAVVPAPAIAPTAAASTTPAASGANARQTLNARRPAISARRAVSPTSLFVGAASAASSSMNGVGDRARRSALRSAAGPNCSIVFAGGHGLRSRLVIYQPVTVICLPAG